MQKRGSTLTLKPVIEILIAVIVISVLMSVGVLYGSHEIFYKLRASRDAGLTTSGLYSIPENAWFKIPYNVSKYKFDFSYYAVKTLTQEGEKTAASYSYVTDTDFKETSIDNPQNLYLFRNGGEFGVGEEIPALKKLNCEKFDLNLRDQTFNFLIDSGFEPVVLKVSLEIDEAVVGCTGCEGIQPVTGKNIELVSGEVGKFKAYFNYESEEMRNLGCMILNNLLDKYPGAKIILVPGKDNLILELGDNEAIKVGTAISEALEDYYE